MNINEFFNLEATIAKDLFKDVENPWEVLPKIKDYIKELSKTLDSEYEKIKEDVYIHKTAKVAKTAEIAGPTIICKNAEIRHSAFIRGSVIVGENSVIGNSTEVKNSIIFNNVQCPHFNYVGDSILGEYSHLGAGVILSNVRSDKKNITIKIEDKKIETNLRKMGALLGKNVEVGCNSVICPGSIVYPNSQIYPLTMVRGIVPKNSIVKNDGTIITKE